MTVTGDSDPEGLTEYTVGAVAQRLGIPVGTLRSWNRRYGIGPTQRNPGRHRYYTVRDIDEVSRMLELIRAGAAPAGAARAARAARRPAPVPGDVAAVVAAAEAMSVAGLTELISTHVTHYGVADTWNRLCRPAFEHIVQRQGDGGSYVEVEHLLSWAVTTSLHRASPVLARPDERPGIVLACTEGEQHVLPLEALRAALAERGCPALFLGASVPCEALVHALARRRHPSRVVLWSQAAATASRATVLAAAPFGADVLLAGPGWSGDPAFADQRHLASLDEALEVLAPE
ncbi:MerR family transcriptional regulator [Nocardia sp. NPDC048505]|uniref:MerR family transcriptional regulator n=1 Tax=unclassified Nocardia TaxID=2637762 RepID=UPI0033DBFC44